MSLDLYHADKQRITKHTDPLIEASLEELASSSSKRSAQLLREMHRKRSGSSRLREYILEQSYLACNSAPVPKSIYEIGAALEVYNMSTYLVNWYLDSKGELQSEKDNYRAVIEGMRLHQKSLEMVRKSSLSDELVERMQYNFSQIDSRLYEGQASDLDELNVSRVVSMTDSEYVTAYLRACKNKCGEFIARSASSGAEIAHASQKKVNALYRYGLSLGTGIQIINDLADFLPLKRASSVERAYQDGFSDVKNGFVTMSMYRLLKQEDSFRKYVGTKLSANKKFNLYQNLLINNCFDTSLQIARYLRTKVAKPALREVFTVDERRRLSQASAILTSSKIHHLLRQNEGYEHTSKIPESISLHVSDVLQI